LENNLYFSPSVNPFVSGFSGVTKQNFANWNSNVDAGTAAGSLFADPLLQNVAHFQIARTTPYRCGDARPRAGPPASPVSGAGAPQAMTFTNNIELQTRAAWNIGAF
jgi:hypothetical protein